MSQTRCLAAILAADVAGYSRLIGADEAGTLGTLKSIRAELINPAIATHLGRLAEARADLRRMLAIDPKLTIAGFREYFHFAAPEVLELYVTGLRQAGLPEE